MYSKLPCYSLSVMRVESNPISRFVAKAFALAMECDCEGGCPRCLHSPGYPQKNLALHKDIGLFLLAAISQGDY